MNSERSGSTDDAYTSKKLQGKRLAGMSGVGASFSSYLFEVLLLPWLMPVMVNPLTFPGKVGLIMAGNGWGSAIYDYGLYFLLFYSVVVAADYRRSKNTTKLLSLVAFPGFLLQCADFIFRVPYPYLYHRILDHFPHNPIDPSWVSLSSSVYLFCWIPFVVFISTILKSAMASSLGTLVWRTSLLLCLIAYFATYIYVGWWVAVSRMGV